MMSVVGCGLPLPFDIEPYGTGDSEYAAGQRLLARAVNGLGALRRLPGGGWGVRHGSLSARRRPGWRTRGGPPERQSPGITGRRGEALRPRPPTRVYRDGQHRVEIWDAEDFDPWETLDWEMVRVIRYRQRKPDGTVVQADWLTNFSSRKVGSLSLYHMAKSRWEIENQGFNDAKNRYGLQHICHHAANSILLNWLLTFLALVIERLYRVRYLHRGTHPVRSAEELCRLLWLGLSNPRTLDSS